MIKNTINLHMKMAGNDPNYQPYSYDGSAHDDDEDDQNQQNYELLDDFLLSDDWLDGDQASIVFGPPVFGSTAMEVGSHSIGSSSHHLQEDGIIGTKEAGKGEKLTKEKVAFKTKSDVEILDDGFKWRKYGKKMVKNSPNPRNYYRCSVEGCSVKKRVERDVEDPSYVITTYEGVHNHEGAFRS